VPRLKQKTPSYRLHRSDGRALVTIDGRDIYLGKHGSPESRAEYDRLIAEWLANGRSLNTSQAGAPSDATVNEVILAFWQHAELHYRHPDGSPTGELDNFRDSLRPLRKLYGSLLAREFSPLKLKAVRKAMIDAGLARTTINQRVSRILRVFRWAASEELIPSGVYQSLKTVAGLPQGRCDAKEAKPVGPVPDSLVEAIQPHVARQVWTMVQLQRLTGMRPGEVVIMRTGDVDRSRDVWTYAPARHKTQHRGKSRRIAIGPRAQEVLTPWLRPALDEYLFSPREAMAEFRAGQRQRRKTALSPSQQARKPKPNMRLSERYVPRSYNHAIRYGCTRAGIPPWHPNQLRHSAATRIRKHSDLDAARAVLGHSDSKTSEIYAERDFEQANRVMREIG
jgi:integrase